MGLEALDRITPQWLKDRAPERVKRRLLAAVDRPQQLPSYDQLARLMDRYTVPHLRGVGAGEFEHTIRGFLSLSDATMEGFRDPERQRDLSVRFRWGHDHDFGSFSLQGAMGDRHVALLATFADRFRAIGTNLSGRRVLDVGCWCGGTSLLLAAMGAEVLAVEEVRKYAACATYLAESFGVDGLRVRNLSLFDCVGPDFDDRFDVVLFAGVLYHVTDPVLALRICFDALRDGGVCLVETAATRSGRSVASYDGPGVRGRGEAAGWNWFRPSVPALSRMMRDVGFSGVRAEPAIGGRAFAVGRRASHVDMLRAGLSRDVR